MYCAYTFTFLECIKRQNYVAIHFEKTLQLKKLLSELELWLSMKKYLSFPENMNSIACTHI